ncbi:MAG: hypothetical protein IPO16_15015 [Saprospiraceae bacterium]|nr:hypothetical protein [Saprospiraceae bacterium]
MKNKIIKIAKDLEQGTVTTQQAQSLLLGLFGVSGGYLMAVKEFGFSLDYEENKDGRKFLDVMVQNGKIKLGEWCKYKDGTFNYR